MAYVRRQLTAICFDWGHVPAKRAGAGLCIEVAIPQMRACFKWWFAAQAAAAALLQVCCSVAAYTTL
jgi:hypothetical protein